MKENYDITGHRLDKSEISLREDFNEQQQNPSKQGQVSIKSNQLFWLSVRSILLDAAVNTTMHGLPGIFRSKNLYVRIMWCLCLLASTGACAYLLIKSVQDYLNYDVVTVTSTIYETPTLFPVNNHK
jgi:hypothetical protein